MCLRAIKQEISELEQLIGDTPEESKVQVEPRDEKQSEIEKIIEQNLA
jgi:hypothetical protein